MEDDLEDEVSACLGKQKHDRATARRIERRYPEAESYKCRFCGHWHLGHKSFRRKRLRCQ